MTAAGSERLARDDRLWGHRLEALPWALGQGH